MVLRSTNQPMFVAIRHCLSVAVGGICCWSPTDGTWCWLSIVVNGNWHMNVQPVHRSRQKLARGCDRQWLLSIVSVLVPDQQQLMPTFMDFWPPLVLLPPDSLLQICSWCPHVTQAKSAILIHRFMIPSQNGSRNMLNQRSIFKLPGFLEYFMFCSLIMKDTNLGPPDLDSPQKYASGDGQIAKFCYEENL